MSAQLTLRLDGDRELKCTFGARRLPEELLEYRFEDTKAVRGMWRPELTCRDLYPIDMRFLAK